MRALSYSANIPCSCSSRVSSGVCPIGRLRNTTSAPARANSSISTAWCAYERGQAVGCVHVDDVDGRHRHEVAQALQSWPDQVGATLAVVEEAQLGRDLVAVRGGTRQ